MKLFLRQFGILFLKNWIVLSKRPVRSIGRCFVLPIAYGILLSVAPNLLHKNSNFGIGDPIPVPSLFNEFDGSLALIWADGTNGNGVPSPEDIMSRVTAGFTSSQLRAVKKVTTPDDISSACPQNLNLFSECFAAISFDGIVATGNDTSAINYTIRADGGLFHIDVQRHNSDYEKRILPLQWAVDQAIIDIKTGMRMPTPLEWPFTQETNEEQATKLRLNYISFIGSLFSLVLLFCYIGIVYQLPGVFSGERANGLTSHLKAMGLLDSARIVSWHASISLAYLPGWIIVAVIWHLNIFTETNVGLILVVHILLGLSLASWTFFVAAPFGKSPQLAAIISTFLAIVFAIMALVLHKATTGMAVGLSIIFPPCFYIFSIRAICGFEGVQIPTNVLHSDPSHHLRLLPLLIVAIINIFLWPYLAVLLERRLYDIHNPSETSWLWWRKPKARVGDDSFSMHRDTAISIRNLGKTYSTSTFHPKDGLVTAISDLTLDIPKFGIYVLLGPNGAGKSTALSIIGGLIGRTSGAVTFEGETERPPRGTLGIVPQKNVLFPELSCYQTLRVWRSVKRSTDSLPDEDIAQLLRDCDLESKMHSNANTLSGGQKRKLQLAIGLIGGSRIVLVDECTSGVDPLSRRALWKTLTSFRYERTIVFTTHFLDEADLLADRIAVLSGSGKLIAEGSPVNLKSTLGEGYSVQVAFDPTHPSDSSEKDWVAPPAELLLRIRSVASHTDVSVTSPYHASYRLKSKDSVTVDKVLQLLDNERKTFGITSYDILGTSIEDIFLELMNQENKLGDTEKVEPQSSDLSQPVVLELTNGRPRSSLNQALTIFHKRALIARRSWLTPLLTMLVAIAGSCISLILIPGGPSSCVMTFQVPEATSLYLPSSGYASGSGSQVLISPPDITSILGSTAGSLRTINVANNATFVNTIRQSYRNLSLGGVSLDFQTGNSLVAWEATPPGINGPIILNLASNIIYNHALNSSTPSLIMANYGSFPPIGGESLVALKWATFFGLAMAVYPAFFALYVSRERRSSVQAMQMSNGLSNPIGLWFGHLMFDSVFSFTLSTIIVIIFATASQQFHGLGFFWVVLVLYGIAGAFFSYCVSLLVKSPLAAFAAVALYQVVMYTLYFAAYSLTLAYATTSNAGHIITIISFTLSLLSPVASAMRAGFISVNLFSLLCNGNTPVTTSSMGSITRYGGPILYLILYSFILLLVLVRADSGSVLPRRRSLRHSRNSEIHGIQATDGSSKQDVVAEAHLASISQDPLRLLHVTKSFSDTKVVDDVSLGVSQDTIFALLGPNGAGKTTLFNLIRGDLPPDAGDILIRGVSVIQHPRTARVALGVCPQFTAIDSQLTVREHLMIYACLKGLNRGEELQNNVDSLMRATALDMYADRLASKLSGGNQRKLSLAIALIGNPSVILIDEFSTGIDAKMKRDLWRTLRKVASGKAVAITTHSMEEASALANKVGILSKQILAIGTIGTLATRYATYEVHFTCRTREELAKAQQLMARIPGSRMADDVATRFEVPIERENGLSLAQLFHLLSTQGDFSEYTVEKATLESIFLKVIRENNIQEEGSIPVRSKRWTFGSRILDNFTFYKYLC